jgi:class 3 adenylate cyclase
VGAPAFRPERVYCAATSDARSPRNAETRDLASHRARQVRFARGVERLEFSVIGDAVNVAARVESATRQTGDLVLIAGRTRELLTLSEIELVERPGLALKGKTRPVEIYAPVRAAAPAGAEA